MWNVRPWPLFLFGLICLLVSFVSSILGQSDLLVGLFVVAGAATCLIAYLYFAVVLINSGMRKTGLLMVWIPFFCYAMVTSPAIGILVTLFAATLDTVLVLVPALLAQRIAKWTEVRFNLPVHFA